MNLSHTKHLLTAMIFAIAVIFTASAQDHTKVIGNKPRLGSANSSYDMVKGNQVGIKMNAGHKPVQLLKLNFDADNQGKDSLKFKVNVYEFNEVTPGKNLAGEGVYGYIPSGKGPVTVDLSTYNITAKGHILVAIEWLQTYNTSNQFAVGLFNGGTYHYENGVWKKTSVAGADFNVLVKKLK